MPHRHARTVCRSLQTRALALGGTLRTVLFATATLAAPDAAAQGCPGCVPLDDLGTGSYLSEQGGLYPGGANTPPPAHLAAALHAARQVVPRSASGAPHPDGLIGVLGVGNSSFGQEWREVARLVDADTRFGGHIVLVTGAINGGVTQMLLDPTVGFLAVLDDRLLSAGVTPEQVQVLVFETARAPVPPLPFVADGLTMRDELADVVRMLRSRFVNLRVALVTTSNYAGYSTIWLSEPDRYEDGFGVKWLIEAQIQGDPGLEFDPRRGPVQAPVLLYGPYLWANGALPRSDGLTWLPSDFEADGFHPSLAGERKVAALYHSYFLTSPVCAVLFRPRDGVTRVVHPIDADAGLDTLQPTAALGTGATVDVVEPNRTALVSATLAPYVGRVVHAKLALEPEGRAGQVEAVGVSDTAWDEALVTAATAPTFDGLATPTLGLASDEMLAEWGVTQWVAALPSGGAGGRVSFGLRKTAATLAARFVARESGRSGWLTLSVDAAPGGVELFCPALPNSTGASALLFTGGSTSLGAADLTCILADLPPFAIALPFVGTAAAEHVLAGGDLCVGGVTRRLAPVQANALGRAVWTVAWAAPPLAVTSGETRTLQALFRDLVPEGYRTTSALVLTFRP
ncbi:MAG: hypothetical protein R3F49_10945 [Planctomycetota bacterium]